MPKLVLHSIFHHFPNKLRYSITVRSERAAEVPLVEEDRIGDIFSRSMLKGENAVMSVKLGKAMNYAGYGAMGASMLLFVLTGLWMPR